MRFKPLLAAFALLAALVIPSLPAEAHGRYGPPVRVIVAPRPVLPPVVTGWLPPLPVPYGVYGAYGYGPVVYPPYPHTRYPRRHYAPYSPHHRYRGHGHR